MSSPSIASLYPILLHGIRADVLVQLGPISVVVARAHGKLMRVYDRTDLDSLGLDAASVYERATKNLEARHSDGSIRVRRGRSPRGVPLVMFEHPTLGASSLLLPELEPIVRSLLRSSDPLAAALIRRDLLVVYADDGDRGSAGEVERWLESTTPKESEMTIVRLSELALTAGEVEIPIEWEEPKTLRCPEPRESQVVNVFDELHDTITDVRLVSPFRNLAARHGQRLSLHPWG